jgi:hypothetical protein
VRLLKAVAIGLPLLVLALIVAAIALSERRRRTLLQASLGIAASMAVLGILLTIGRSVYLDLVAGPNLPRDAATAFYEILVHYLRLGLRIVAAVALLIAAGAFITAAGSTRQSAGATVRHIPTRRPWDNGLPATSEPCRSARSSCPSPSSCSGARRR